MFRMEQGLRLKISGPGQFFWQHGLPNLDPDCPQPTVPAARVIVDPMAGNPNSIYDYPALDPDEEPEDTREEETWLDRENREREDAGLAPLDDSLCDPNSPGPDYDDWGRNDDGSSEDEPSAEYA